jgi:GAF domain-containing protein/anti-sigma regulatory factor (Ser/Thr protein kinase)
MRGLLRLFPSGDFTSDASWRARHTGILVVVWAHVVGVPLIGWRRQIPPVEAALISAPIALFAIAATVPLLHRRLRAVFATAALLFSSAILVYFFNGLTEVNFHYFVMVVLVSMYQDWLPFAVAVSFVLVHHGLIGTLEPSLVYDSPEAMTHPWRWAAIHAGFVAAISAVSVAGWRLTQAVIERQRRAEQDLMDEKRVVETLHSIGTGVVAELDLGRAAQLVTDAAVHAVGAAFGAFFYNVQDRGGDRAFLYATSGAPHSAFDPFTVPATDASDPSSSVVRIDDVLSAEHTDVPLQGIPKGQPQVRSYLAVPVRSRGSSEVLGRLCFGHPEPAVFTEQDERLAVGIATQAAIAFDNARLYQAERQAHEMAEASQERLALLAETGRLVTTSLDQSVTLREIARLTVPTLADACLIDVPDDDGRIVRISTGGPGLERFVQGLVPFPPGFDDISHPIIRAMRTGEPTLVRQISGEFLATVTRAPQHRKIAEELRPRSIIIVPLVGRDDLYGSLTLINVELSERTFGPDDFALAEEIGRRAGMAVENARLYNQQRTVAESLQHALLPDQLPTITGFEATARYLPGTPGERVGGDWYDLFEVPSGEIAIAMGDVVGHGIPAASMMAQLRNALRAYVWDGFAPGEVLGRLNNLLNGLEPEGMATASVAMLDPVTTKLRLASAGHLPVLHVRDGVASFVGEGLGPPLGAVPFARFDEISLELRPEDIAVFYTDGLVEDRTVSLDVGLEHMRAAVMEGADTIEELTDAVLRSCLHDRLVDDDVAVLVLRSVPLGDHLKLRLPSEPRILGSLRQTLRRWMHEQGVVEDDARDVLIACGEACNNAIEHGTASYGGWFEVEAGIDEELRIAVRNGGGWREPRDDGGGRGLPLMEALMDDVEIDRGDERIEVRMRLRLHARGGTPGRTKGAA